MQVSELIKGTVIPVVRPEGPPAHGYEMVQLSMPAPTA
jgi:hypothetical protein